MSGGEERWELNYFNYFTEIEERFRQARGTGLFLLSPLDWALIETWKNAGIPLEAVLRGIDKAFATWRSRQGGKRKTRMINSLTYCTQAVVEEAEAMAGVEQKDASRQVEPVFEIEQLREHLEGAVEALRAREDNYYTAIIEGVERVLAELETHHQNVEELEMRLSAIEEKMASIARIHQSEEQLFEARRGLERQLKQYRGKMKAEQIAMLEKQYLDRALLESAGLPRLSLFYMR